MSDEDRMQREAYCLEYDAIVTAQSAHQHPKHSYFCTEEICLIPVTPSKGTKNYFFKAFPNNLHHPDCRYFKEPEEKNGPGDPKSPSTKFSMISRALRFCAA